jgi:hypothetical protein
VRTAALIAVQPQRRRPVAAHALRAHSQDLLGTSTYIHGCWDPALCTHTGESMIMPGDGGRPVSMPLLTA